MMARTQILLDRQLLRAARKKAAELGVSLAEYVRRLVARDLREPAPAADPSAVFNLGDSGGADVAGDKDAMVGSAVSAQRGARDR
jgi:hypothetical protein